MEYGYARVSSKDQNEDRQRDALMEAGIPEERIFVDKKSGKDFERPAYKQMLHLFQKGDVLYIKSIDRLGRNYNEIQEQWRFLTNKMEIDIVVLDMPLLDTRQGKNLVGTFVSDLVLQVLSFVAENERANIRQRQAEGIAAAKARGKHLGRPFRPLPPNFHEVYRRWMDGELTCLAAAKAVGMPRSTFLYRVRYMREAGLLERKNSAAEKYTLLQPSKRRAEGGANFNKLYKQQLWKLA